MNNIIKNIDNLPPLSQTVIDTLDLSIKETKTPEDLIEIIKDDTLTIAMLLKTANSAIFGFRNEVENIENLLHLLGIDFAISIILANALQNNFDVDFSPYGIDSNKFRESTSLKVNLLNQWITRTDVAMAKKLFLPVILIDLGKYIIANQINSLKKKNEFLKDINNNLANISDIEKKYFNISSIDITIKILEHWKVNLDIINVLNKRDTKEFKIINIIASICNIVKPFDEKLTEIAIKEAQQNNLNDSILEKSIEKILNNLNEE